MTNLKPQISSISTGPRQSNMELLRIFAMFLVLVVHATFYSTGATTLTDFINSPVSSFCRTFFESASIVCVNVFILISGWFGIKPSMRGGGNFLFQCLYFISLLYVLSLVIGISHFSIKGLIENFMCKPRGYWFILSYASLYIISPILNSFVKNSSKARIRIVLILFFLFQTIWGWSGLAGFFDSGYSAFSFIGLYLLSRYVKLYGKGKIIDYGGTFYVSITFLNIFLYYLTILFSIKVDIFNYLNPLVIIQALGLLLWFSKIKVKKNIIINWFGQSAFAVYLFHCNQAILAKIFKPTVLSIYIDYQGPECILRVFAVLLIFFITAVLLDQPRRMLWNTVSIFFQKTLIQTT